MSCVSIIGTGMFHLFKREQNPHDHERRSKRQQCADDHEKVEHAAKKVYVVVTHHASFTYQWKVFRVRILPTPFSDEVQDHRSGRGGHRKGSPHNRCSRP